MILSDNAFLPGISILLSLFLSSLSELSAQNLIPNGDFENYSACPPPSSVSEYCTDWYQIAGTPDYYNCGVYILKRSSMDSVCCIPASGDGAIGFLGIPEFAGCNGEIYKESFGARLIKPLTKCHRYRLAVDLAIGRHNDSTNPEYGNPCMDVAFYLYNEEWSGIHEFCGCSNDSVRQKPLFRINASELKIGDYQRFVFEFTALDSHQKIMISPECNDRTGTSDCSQGGHSVWGPYSLYFNIDNIELVEIPAVELHYSALALCIGDTVSITHNLADSLTSLNWNFTNATLVSRDSLTSYFRFDAPGIYPIQCTISGLCGSTELFFQDSISIHPKYDAIILDSSLVLCEQTAVQIQNFHPELHYNWSDGYSGGVRKFPTPGVYHVTCTDDFGCHHSTADVHINLLNTIQIYPNPTNDTWHIGEPLSLPNQIALYGVNGQLVWHDSDLTTFNLDAALLRLTPGNYILAIHFEACSRIFKVLYIK